jgi:kinesin family protein 6/9
VIWVLFAQVHVSYLEIFNEAGYDLLDQEREVRLLEDLPRVHVLEDEDAVIHTRNLSMHRATTEEDALNLVRTPVLLGTSSGAVSQSCMIRRIISATFVHV